MTGRRSDTAETEALGLTAAERQILAALAVVGHASLSADELADLGVTSDVIPLLEDLERRGLIRLDERRRYSVLRGVGEQLRRTDSALARAIGCSTTSRRLRGAARSHRRGSTTTPRRSSGSRRGRPRPDVFAAARARQDAQAASASRTARAMADAGSACATAARVLGDRQSEIWALRELAAAAASAGTRSAQRYLREADELRTARSRSHA